MNLLSLGGPQVGFFYNFADFNDSELDYSNDTSLWIVDTNGTELVSNYLSKCYKYMGIFRYY